MTQIIEHERRQYFRIRDQIGLKLRPIVNDNPTLADTHTDRGIALIRALQQLEQEFNERMATMADMGSDSTTCLRLLNQKIDHLARHIVTAEVEATMPRLWVSLSGSGISLLYPDFLGLELECTLVMLLYPTLTFVQTNAQVVRCESAVGGYQISFRFTEITENDRDLIMRHALQRDAQWRREQKLKSAE